MYKELSMKMNKELCFHNDVYLILFEIDLEMKYWSGHTL